MKFTIILTNSTGAFMYKMLQLTIFIFFIFCTSNLYSVQNGNGSHVFAGKNLVLKTSDVRVCYQEDAYAECSIQNIGTSEINIDTVFVYPYKTNFWVDIAIRVGFVLKPGELKDLPVLFNGWDLTKGSTQLHVKTSDTDEPELTGPINYESYAYRRNVSLEPDSIGVNVGSNTEFSVIIQPGEDLKELYLQEFGILIRYNPQYYIIDTPRVFIRKDIEQDFKINELISKPSEGKLEVPFITKDSSRCLNHTGELLKFVCQSLSAKPDSTFAPLIVSVYPIKTFCLIFNPLSITGKIFTDVEEYNIPNENSPYSISPNPVTSDILTLHKRFNNNFNNNIIVCEILNILGETVQRYEIKDQGSFLASIDMPFEKLATGMYFLKIRDNKGITMKKFIVE